MYNDFIDKCKLLLRRPDVQEELRMLVKPLLDYIMVFITPYIYISLILVVISFLLILGIFIGGPICCIYCKPNKRQSLLDTN